ncbi:MAG: PTS sugar transporter subunit IIB [Lawsonibacter sp.]|nr:PTS sugar transporter subunit IIB [Lawsonibacter sp.]
MKTIIVACGGGIATSSTVATKINTELEDRGLAGKAKVEAVDIKSLDLYMSTADIYVSITPTARVKKEYPIPVISGIPFLTGVGREETMDRLVELIKA